MGCCDQKLHLTCINKWRGSCPLCRADVEAPPLEVVHVGVPIVIERQQNIKGFVIGFLTTFIVLYNIK